MLATFFIYLLKSATSLLAFSLFFRLFLLSDTFVRFTRIILLGGILLCLLLPLYHWKLEKTMPIHKPVNYVENYVENLLKTETQVQNEVKKLKPLNNNATFIIKKQKPWSKSVFWVLLTYVLGVLFMLSRLLFSFYNLWKITHNGQRVKYQHQELILIDRHISAFSFFHYIVISRQDFEESPQEIITHEQMHSKYWHSIDALFMELLLVAQWFNVGLWSLRNDLRSLHEYEADRGVLKKGIDATKYQLLLIKKVVGERCFTSVVNNFNHSLIKNRITMMLKKNTNPLARLKVLLMLPLMGGILYAFAHPTVENTMNTVQQDIVNVAKIKEESTAMLVWKRVVESSPLKEMDREFLKMIQTKQTHTIIFNKYNKLRYDGIEFPTDFSIEKVSKVVENDFYKQWKYFNQLGERYKPQLFDIQTKTSNTDIKNIIKITDALIKGYNQAATKIAKELDLSYEKFSEKCPLLLVLNNPFQLLLPPAKGDRNTSTNEIAKIHEEEKTKQCHIKAFSSDNKGIYMAANYPIEVLRELLKPELRKLSKVTSFSMYLGEAERVNIKNITELKKLLRLNKISRVSYSSTESKSKFKLPKEKNKNWQENKNIPKSLPLEKSAIKNTVGFGMRIDPITKAKKMHTGIDFAAKEGTPIIAPADGIVVSTTFSNKAFGNKIVLKHNYRFQSSYAHLQNIKVKNGQKVKKGQIIGTVGMTGVSSCPHLHYEILKDNRNVNPHNYFSMK